MNETFNSKVRVTKDFQTIGKIMVEWRFAMEEQRSWGIKGFSITCPDQVCPYTEIDEVDTGNEDSRGHTIYEPVTKDAEIRIENVEVDFDMSNRKMNSDIFPIEIEIYKGKVTLKFQE